MKRKKLSSDISISRVISSSFQNENINNALEKCVLRVASIFWRMFLIQFVLMSLVRSLDHLFRTEFLLFVTHYLNLFLQHESKKGAGNILSLGFQINFLKNFFEKIFKNKENLIKYKIEICRDISRIILLYNATKHSVYCELLFIVN